MTSTAAAAGSRPLVVYLDSSDYSNLASAASNPALPDAARGGTRARVCSPRKAGSAVFRFSYPPVM